MNFSFTVYNLLGRCLDNSIWLGAGVLGLLYYPRRIRREVKAGTLGEIEAKKKLQTIRLCCYFAIAVGVLRILGILP